MDKRLKELADQAGVTFDSLGASYTFGSLQDCLEHFAELVRQDEREACAKALETGVDFKNIEDEPLFFKLCLDIVCGCAQLIRARGEQA